MGLIEKTYEQETNKELVNDLVEVLIADLHYSPKMCIKILNDLLDYLEENKDIIDFVCIPGDLTCVKGYVNDRRYSYLKGFLDEMSKTVNKPIFLSLGNHDRYKRFKENKKARGRFRDLSDGDIIALDNECFALNEDVNIIGLSGKFTTHTNHTPFGCSSESLIKDIKDTTKEISNDKFNIALVHDPNSVYLASDEEQNQEYANIDQFISGHLHGGYVKAKKLLALPVDHPNYGYGRIECLEHGMIKYPKTPRCYGKYELDNGISNLIITEGIRRYNGYLPKRVYNNPFVTKINIKSKVLRKER